MKPCCANRCQKSLAVPLLAAAVLTIHVGLAAWLGLHQSPNVDEPAHLAAGMAMWQYGRFELYCVNPPLMRALATLPILCMPHEPVWGDFERAPRPRPEFVLGEQFVESHPDRWRRFLVAARWAILPFTVLGGLVCYFWAAELFDRQAGLMALTLWCFSPNVLTWSSIVCTDGAATAVGVAAGYVFWRCLRRPAWDRAALTGLFLGLALLSKMTWLVLIALWPALWILWRGAAPAGQLKLSRLAVVLLIGIYVLNLGYAFSGSMTPLGNIQFSSRLFGGAGDPNGDSAPAGSSAGNVLRLVPVPLPVEFVRGADLQRADFEKGKPSYLFGKWSNHGWRHYYLVGLALKVPLGTWCLALLAVIGCSRGWRRPNAPISAFPLGARRSISALDHVAVLAPAASVLALVSSQNGFSAHFRYALPVLPFLFVWVSQVASQISWSRPLLAAAMLAALAWSAGSSLAVFPHTMSYFNELAGGPANGHRHMLGSSLSWSQDHFYLRDWLREHTEADSPYMLLERSVSLERLGLRSRGEPPPGTRAGGKSRGLGIAALGPVPGWHAVSVQRIHDPNGAYLYFQAFEPVATIGYSTRIYRIRLDEANRVRRATGIPEITEAPLPPSRLIAELAGARSSLRPLRVALLSAAQGAGAPAPDRQLQKVVENNGRVSLSTVTASDIRGGCLKSCDVFLVPGGHASVQGSLLGSEGRAVVRDFVRRGGGYLGICAGAHLACVNHEWGLKLVNARAMSGERFVPGYGRVRASFRGWGSLAVDLSKEGGRVFDGPFSDLQMSYTGGPVFSRANEPGLPDYVPLASFRSEVWKYPFQKGTMIDTPAVLAAQFGHGKVILFSPHPEAVTAHAAVLTQALLACGKISAPDTDASAR